MNIKKLSVGFLIGLSSYAFPKQKPNVIVILTDDQGYKDVGFNGCKDIPTPNIDRIASNGAKFTNAYVSYAVCGPSRAGLMTGRYQDRFGFGRNPLFAPNDPNMGLPTSEQTLGSALQTAGYTCQAIGKWHLGAHPSLRPLNRGFDEFFGFLSGGHQYFPEQLSLNDLSEVKRQFDAYKTKLLKNNMRVDEKEYITDALSREAVKFIDKNAENPFFIYLAYNAPHAPLQATEKYLKRFPNIKNKKRKTYAAMVSAVDDGVGNVLDKLEELGIDDNTIVFFLSDNGGPEHHNSSDNGELRAGKGSLYEGGIRVPFAMQWTGVIPKNTVYEKPIISFDIFGTAIAHANVTPKNEIDGVDLVPYLTGENKNTPHEALFWRKFDAKSFAVRSGDFKLVKMSKKKKKGQVELFNINEDISEKNQIKTNKTTIQRLKALRKNWLSKVLDPVFLGLMQDKKYTKKHPDRFEVEPY